ncbi:MAG: hypothetical protein ACC628_18210 [Pirellulaceae bacterium]
MSTLTVTTEGTIRFTYDDDMADMRALGKCQIKRASHVEPTPDGHWTADMAPSGGPVLGPFNLRGDALSAEREWLEDRMS